MASRKLEDLHPRVEKMAKALLDKCKVNGIDLLIYCTFRESKEQEQLYAIGRITPGQKVTNAKAGESYHNYGLAFDCVPLVGGKTSWGRNDLYNKIATYAKEIGLEWAGNWKTFKEYPHFQWTGGLTIAQLKSGKKPV
jgi:peptidoglycan L-alanyl-D-glutamate endopeptidase CwlK